MARISSIFNHFYHVSVVWDIYTGLCLRFQAHSFSIPRDIFLGNKSVTGSKEATFGGFLDSSRMRDSHQKDQAMTGGLGSSSPHPALGKGEEAEIEAITNCQWLNLKSCLCTDTSLKPLKDGVRRTSRLLNIFSFQEGGAALGTPPDLYVNLPHGCCFYPTVSFAMT